MSETTFSKKPARIFKKAINDAYFFTHATRAKKFGAVLAIPLVVISSAQDKDEVIKKKQGFLVLDKDCNLLSYPHPRKDNFGIKRQYTLGDLHANALKLVYFLIKENLLEMDQASYEDFCRFYLKPSMEITKEDLLHFEVLLGKMKFKKIEDRVMVRLLGDEFCDRGENDYYVLKILEKLQKEGVPFEILFSNHGYELISNFEKGLLEHTSYLEKIDCGASLVHLKEFIKRGLVSQREVDHLIKKVYYPHLKLLSYSQDLRENRKYFTIYSHAPIGLCAIRYVALH